MSLFRRLQATTALKAARAAGRARDWPRAAEHYEAYLGIDRRAFRAWIQYGHALKEQGRLDDAEIAYLKAVDARPDRPEGYREYGLFLSRLGRLRDAAIAFGAGLVVSPADSELRDRMAFLQLGEREATQSGWLGALAVRTRMPAPAVISFAERPLLIRARKASRRRDWGKAAALYRELVAKAGRVPGYHVQLGHMVKEMGQVDAAAAAYRDAIAADPFHIDAHLQLGHTYKRLGDQDAAQTAFANAARLDPLSIEARRELGWAGLRADRLADMIGATWGPAETVVASAEASARVRDSRGAAAAARPPETLNPRERQIWLDLFQHVGMQT